MPKSKKRTKKVSFLKNKFVILAGLAIVVALGFKALFGLVAQPAGVNEVALENKKITITDGKSISKTLPNGCVEKQVQCIQAPCEPILVCPPGATTTPSQVCSQEAGSCMTTSGQCAGYSDGCIKARICATPYQTCNTGKPSPVPTATAVPMPSSRPSCYCPPGAKCKLSAECSPMYSPTPSYLPSPVPSPVAVPAVGIEILKVSGACGNDSFLNITYSCQSNKANVVTLADNTCTDFYVAMKKINTECGVIK